MMNKRSIILGVSALLMSAMPAMAAPTKPVEVLNGADSLLRVEKRVVFDGIKLVQNQISPAQAKAIALSRVKGGQYVDLRKSGNTYIVRVRAPGGRVVDIKVDATTGRVK